MKTIKISTLLILLVFISCSKEDNPDSLEYTYWTGYSEDSVYRTLHFKPDYKCVDRLYIKLDGTPIEYELSYRHNGNSVDLIQATGVYAEGIINGDILTMDYGYTDGILQFKKRD